MNKYQNKYKVLNNEKINDKYFKLVLDAKDIADIAIPGQFLMLKVCTGNDPLLRRPISIHNCVGNKVEMLYEVVGKGTEILANIKNGEFIEVIGPLGNGFDIKNTDAVLVAGGMGVAPLIFLAQKLKQKKINGLVLIGGRSKEQILCEEEFKSLGFKVLTAADDGSEGFKGRVTELLNRELLSIDHHKFTIYSCGPKPMLKELQRISQEKNIEAQVSLESHMACGIGACLGCVVNTKEGFKRVCKEGPVFDASCLIL